ncbi:MAG: type II toxin-antitoxin system VapC family toxin [Opitutaceae bacterium]|nr:type II toxin-antitoxin system VapC family toxin [Opitutaceae bacterium]
MSESNIVDSSGWLEYLADSKSAAFFAPAIEDTGHLLVPVITVYEVFKKVLRERGENEALQVVSIMQSGLVIEVDAALALDAARYDLPLADSLIYATALRHGATLWTQDEHFKDLPGVRYLAKKAATR